MCKNKLKVKPKLAVSRCLLGDNVRYDGQEKSYEYVTTHISQMFEILPICPEVEIGLSVPRKPMHLVKKDHQIYAVLVDNSSEDFTYLLNQHAKMMQQQVASVSGYIFKARSPSCGVKTTLLHRLNNFEPDNNSAAKVSILDKKVSGIFAQSVMNNNPYMPIVDESTFNDADKRAQFAENVHCYFHFFHAHDLLKQKGRSNIDQYIRDFGLLWVLRTGQSIGRLEAVSALGKESQFNALYFESINYYSTKEEQINYIKNAVNNNTPLFSCLGASFTVLFELLLNNKTTIINFKYQLSLLLSKNNTIKYRLSLSH